MVMPARFALGALPRPHDPRELAYRLRVATEPDMTQLVSLRDYLPQVYDQQTMGSCVANAVCESAKLLAIKGGKTPVDVSRLWVYARGREAMGTFPEDSGLYVATGFDVALAGVPKETLAPYQPDPRIDPPHSIDADALAQDWIQAHQPLYSTDPGGFLGGIWTALGQGKPVAIGMLWHDAFFGVPASGVLPVVDMAGVNSGHCIMGYAAIPAAANPTNKRLVACFQSWGGGWPGGVGNRAIWPQATPNTFYLREEHFVNGTVFEVRAASPEPVTPDPTPNPRPAPTERQAWMEVWTRAGEKWTVANGGRLPVSAGGAWLTTKAQTAGGPIETVQGFKFVAGPKTSVLFTLAARGLGHWLIKPFDRRVP